MSHGHHHRSTDYRAATDCVRGQRSPRSVDLGGNALAYAFLLLLVAIVILPFGWMTTVALKPNNVPVFTLAAAVVSDGVLALGQFPPSRWSIRRNRLGATS